MASLMPLRSDLLRDDTDAFISGGFALLRMADLRKINGTPVPAGLEELSGPLHALIEFSEIDEDLVEVAAQASKPLTAGPSRRELSHGFGACGKGESELLITAVVDQDERWPKRPGAAFSTYETYSRLPTRSL